MRVCGIIAEFNPFHNGHKALIDAARGSGADCVVCVMSGNFVQRASPAVTDKRVRAKAALLNGADMVVELPLPFATGTAQRFARGAVHLLKSMGCVDTIAFGSECGDAESLKALAGIIDEPRVTATMRATMKTGMTFAKARQLAVEKVYGEGLASLLSKPNNVLGVEYLRQAKLMKVKAGAFTVKRVGAGHDAPVTSGDYASASYLRENAGSFDVLSRYTPETAAAVYADAMVKGLFPSNPDMLNTAILSHLRRLSLPEMRELPDISEGLENRLYAAIRKASGVCELEAMLKTKRYTMARVRRLILAAFLGVTAKDAETLPPYLRVIGFNGTGRKLLGALKSKCDLPNGTSLAALRAKSGVCERFAWLEELSTDIFGLTLPKVLPCGYEYTEQGVFCELKNR